MSKKSLTVPILICSWVLCSNAASMAKISQNISNPFNTTLSCSLQNVGSDASLPPNPYTCSYGGWTVNLTWNRNQTFPCPDAALFINSAQEQRTSDQGMKQSDSSIPNGYWQYSNIHLGGSMQFVSSGLGPAGQWLTWRGERLMLNVMWIFYTLFCSAYTTAPFVSAILHPEGEWQNQFALSHVTHPFFLAGPSPANTSGLAVPLNPFMYTNDGITARLMVSHISNADEP